MKKIVLMFVFVFLFCSPVFAAEVKLGWDAHIDIRLKGYKIHYGNAIGVYTTHIDVKNVTTYTVTDLIEGETYYFAATVYGSIPEIESDYSDELSYVVPFAPMTPPTGLKFSPKVANLMIWDKGGGMAFYNVYEGAKKKKRIGTTENNWFKLPTRYKRIKGIKYFCVNGIFLDESESKFTCMRTRSYRGVWHERG
jgi:hypothetical protein